MSSEILVSSEDTPIEINPTQPTLLLVDDTLINLELLEDILEDLYNLPVAHNGEDAWTILQTDPHLFDAVLLDRMMPDILGEEVLRRIQEHSELKHIPVIFQTAKSSQSDLNEGLALGADYYVSKPYNTEQLLAAVQSAVKKRRRSKIVLAEMKKLSRVLNSLSLLVGGTFEFEVRTIREVTSLSMLLSHLHSNPEQIVGGLMELGYNGIEHGIAKIGYESKSELLEKQSLADEVTRRLELPENKNKTVHIQVERLRKSENIDELRFVITDPGDGFDHQQYLTVSPERLFDDHGRGIAMTAQLSFDELHYNEKGNSVTAICQLQR